MKKIPQITKGEDTHLFTKKQFVDHFVQNAKAKKMDVAGVRKWATHQHLLSVVTAHLAGKVPAHVLADYPKLMGPGKTPVLPDPQRKLAAVNKTNTSPSVKTERETSHATYLPHTRSIAVSRDGMEALNHALNTHERQSNWYGTQIREADVHSGYTKLHEMATGSGRAFPNRVRQAAGHLHGAFQQAKLHADAQNRHLSHMEFCSDIFAPGRNQRMRPTLRHEAVHGGQTEINNDIERRNPRHEGMLPRNRLVEAHPAYARAKQWIDANGYTNDEFHTELPAHLMEHPTLHNRVTHQEAKEIMGHYADQYKRIAPSMAHRPFRHAHPFFRPMLREKFGTRLGKGVVIAFIFHRRMQGA